MGAVFDRVERLANNRPPLPRAQGTEQGRRMQIGVDIDIVEALDAVSQYETRMDYWLSEIRTLADPTLRDPGDRIVSGSSAYFDAFWRTLVYNRSPRFDLESPNKKPSHRLGISFRYWYLWKKL